MKLVMLKQFTFEVHAMFSHTHIHVCMHTHTHTQNTHLHIHTHTHSYTLTHTHTYKHTHTHTHTYKHTHTLTHTHTHTHNTHTHTIHLPFTWDMKLEDRTTGLVEMEASDSTRFVSLATLIKTARMQKAKDVHLLFPLQGALWALFFFPLRKWHFIISLLSSKGCDWTRHHFIDLTSTCHKKICAQTEHWLQILLLLHAYNHHTVSITTPMHDDVATWGWGGWWAGRRGEVRWGVSPNTAGGGPGGAHQQRWKQRCWCMNAGVGLPACPGSAWAAGSILRTLDERGDSYAGAPPFFV